MRLCLLLCLLLCSLQLLPCLAKPRQTPPNPVLPVTVLQDAAVPSSPPPTALPSPPLLSLSSPSPPPPSSPPSTPSPSAPPPTSVFYDAGSPANPAPPGAQRVTHAASLLDAHTLHSAFAIPPSAFAASLQGESFDLSFNLPAATYDVTLAFVETVSCEPNSESLNIFNVDFNGNVRLQGYDIYSASNGCGKARFETFSRHLVDSIKPSPLVIAFRAVSGVASISFILISPSSRQCAPVTQDLNVLDDHLAHSVPGRYPPSGETSYIDFKALGYVDVRLDARGSHTHFAYAGGEGKITSYEWTDAQTGKVLSRLAVFTHRFTLGSTRLTLSVTDNACTRDEADTSITVTGSMQKGQYCYYYTWQPMLPEVGTLSRWPRPKFAASSKSTRLKFPAFSFQNTRFITRCIFFVNFGTESKPATLSVHTGMSGLARVYIGGDLVIDSYTAPSSGGLVMPEGLTAFEVIYQRRNLNKKAQLVFKVDGKIPGSSKVSHDRSTVLPIITSVFPRSGPQRGGGQIKINGFGLSENVRIFFGPVLVKVRSSSASNEQIFVTAPSSSSSLSVASSSTPSTSDVRVFAQNAPGIRSNMLTYAYTEVCDNVSFEKRRLQLGKEGGQPVNLHQPTSVATSRDGSLYVGLRDGSMKVIQFNSLSLIVSRVCSSKPLTDARYIGLDGSPANRSILGVTFDPRDVGDEPRPYVSVSTMFWRGHKNIDEIASTAAAWSNGAIVRFKWIDGAFSKDFDNICLEYDATIVRNLPVSDNDHSVNDLVFNNDGDLLISVGGSTNMGLPSSKLGGKWETFLGSSVLIAKLSLGDAFNGDIPYTTPEEYLTAMPMAGYTDVELFATGLRNLFSLTMARNGRLYGVDMGPNCKFGNASSSCSDMPAGDFIGKRHWVHSFDGKIEVDKKDANYKNCTYGPGGDDKVVQIKRNRFYGHPNVQRGMLSPRYNAECAYVSPLKGKSIGRRSAPWNYEPPLSMIRSAKTAVLEYGSNVFCGRVRGDLVFSANTENGIWRLKLDENGRANGKPFPFQPRGGIRMVENSHGDLLFPLYGGSDGVYVARPIVKQQQPKELQVLNVMPFRAGRKGGGMVLVGGAGFDAAGGVAVTVGDGDCAEAEVRRGGTEIACRMPGLGGGEVGGGMRLQSVTVTMVGDGRSVTLRKAVLYMGV